MNTGTWKSTSISRFESDSQTTNFDFYFLFRFSVSLNYYLFHLLQADHSAEALEKYLFYGCYCFPDGHQKLFSGYGEPIDEIDRVCKAFQTCYRCVGIDFGQEECINSKGYEFKVAFY